MRIACRRRDGWMDGELGDQNGIIKEISHQMWHKQKKLNSNEHSVW